jgi:predicted phosphodiesterase
MKYLILSDIHSNLEALQAVSLKILSTKIDKYVILGDLVGYGASPNEVVEIIKKKSPLVAIRGNHDKVASGLSDGRGFNHIALEADLWTQEILSSENKKYIADLPKGPINVDGLFDIMHGSNFDEEYYIDNDGDAIRAFQESNENLLFFGHTHIPIIWVLDEQEGTIEIDFFSDELQIRSEYSLQEGKRYLINPGSVGQPRDRIPESSFAIFDSNEMKVTLFRIKYNIKTAQDKIIRAGLDEFLAERLAIGR